MISMFFKLAGIGTCIAWLICLVLVIFTDKSSWGQFGLFLGLTAVFTVFSNITKSPTPQQKAQAEFLKSLAEHETGE